MGNEREWAWRVGALQGFGESAWEESDGWIRRITVLMPNPRGGAFLVTPIFYQFTSGKPEVLEYLVSSVVIVSNAAKPELAEDLKRHWSGVKLVRPGNGPMPPPPRIIQ